MTENRIEFMIETEILESSDGAELRMPKSPECEMAILSIIEGAR
ncbi:MAG: hypothetical protein U0V70_06685 [Terriglobia bacterium]